MYNIVLLIQNIRMAKKDKKAKKKKSEKVTSEQIDSTEETIVNEAAEAEALEQEELDKLEDQEDAEEAELLGEEKAELVQKKPAEKRVTKKASTKERFSFEKKIIKGDPRTYLKIFLDGELQKNYYGALLVGGANVMKILRHMSILEPMNVLIPLEMGEKKGIAAHEVGINGVCFIIPKGAYVSVPSNVGKLIIDAFDQTTVALDQNRIDNLDPESKIGKILG